MPAYETEERDERGRWTSGGGDAAAAPGTEAYERHLEKMEVTAEQSIAVWKATGPGNFALSGLQNGEPSPQGVEQYLESSSSLNMSLRAGEDIPADSIDGESMAAVDSEIARSAPTTEDTTLFRGIGMQVETIAVPGVDYGAMEPGEQFREPSFASTSTSYGMARQFAEPEEEVHGQMLEMHVPAGTQGLYVSQSEGEVILPRGAGFEVVSQEPDRTVVKMVP